MPAQVQIFCSSSPAVASGLPNSLSRISIVNPLGRGWGEGQCLFLRRCRLANVLLCNLGECHDAVAFVRAHHSNTLSIAAHDAYVLNFGACHHPILGNEHDLIAVPDAGGSDHLAVLRSYANVLHPLAAAPLTTVTHVGRIGFFDSLTIALRTRFRWASSCGLFARLL